MRRARQHADAGGECGEFEYLRTPAATEHAAPSLSGACSVLGRPASIRRRGDETATLAPEPPCRRLKTAQPPGTHSAAAVSHLHGQHSLPAARRSRGAAVEGVEADLGQRRPGMRRMLRYHADG